MPFEDDDWKFEVIHQSRPPLRWIANLAGSIATSGILDASYMEDNGGDTFKYKFSVWKWNTFWPISQKYGSFYKLKNEIDGDL